MTSSNPSPGRAPGLPDERPRLVDIHLEAVHLAGLLHLLDNFEPDGLKDQSAVVSLISVAEPLAPKIAKDLEQVMP